ncbi:DUF2721 domain-containing protein [Candidatus Dojkabacteria bacterium]|jgi:hypothetical protein|nr:DUF2721 domain-containing protein [Candidatus Dojkabacteria bacterium]
MIHPEIFQAFVAPAIFFSAAGLLILSINVRQMAIVSRLRAFHKEKYQAVVAGKRQEAVLLQAQISSIEPRARKIRNAFLYSLIGIFGVLCTCLILGLAVYVPEAMIIAVITFVISVISMIGGTYFYISEVAISLTSEREEEQFYALLEAIEPKNKNNLI